MFGRTSYQTSIAQPGLVSGPFREVALQGADGQRIDSQSPPGPVLIGFAQERLVGDIDDEWNGQLPLEQVQIQPADCQQLPHPHQPASGPWQRCYFRAPDGWQQCQEAEAAEMWQPSLIPTAFNLSSRSGTPDP